MHTPLDSLEIAPELRSPLDRAHERRAAPRFSVVAVELGERFGRRAELDDIAAARGLNSRDGGGVGFQYPEVRPAACGRVLEDDSHRLVDGEALLRELSGGFVPDVPLNIYAHRYLHSDLFTGHWNPRTCGVRLYTLADTGAKRRGKIGVAATSVAPVGGFDLTRPPTDQRNHGSHTHTRSMRPFHPKCGSKWNVASSATSGNVPFHSARSLTTRTSCQSHSASG